MPPAKCCHQAVSTQPCAAVATSKRECESDYVWLNAKLHTHTYKNTYKRFHVNAPKYKYVGVATIFRHAASGKWVAYQHSNSSYYNFN